MENMPQICPKCGMAINPGDNATVCPVCGVAHHLNCWIENQGCAVAACPSKQPVAPVEQPVAPVEQPVAPVEQPVAPVEQPVAPVEPAYQQPAYQAPVEPAYQQPAYQQPAQPAYQAPVGPTICSTCGATITGAFCPKCGQPASVVGVTAAAAQYGAVAAPKKKSKAPLIIGVIAAVVVLIIIISAISGGSGPSGLGGRRGPDLEAIYNEYCSSTWADVGSDGSYLSVDTNPFNWDDDGLAYEAAWDAVKEINAELGLPESLAEDMSSTRGMDGKQTRTYSDKNLEVSWSYHPDKGLEVTYRKIN